MFISDTLNEMGHIVVGPVRTIDDALTMIDKEMIDLALLDINLGAGKTSIRSQRCSGAEMCPSPF
jgi:hypothetical protein